MTQKFLSVRKFPFGVVTPKMAHGPRPVEVAAVPAASPPPHLPPPGKPFGLPQVAAMPSCPGHVSAAVIYCHSSELLRIIVSAAASSGHWGRAPNGSKETV